RGVERSRAGRERRLVQREIRPAVRSPALPMALRPRAHAAVMPALRPLFALALLAASGCTFGVDPVEVRGEDTLDAAGITLLREDLSSASDLRLTGIDEPRIRAALVTRG